MNKPPKGIVVIMSAPLRYNYATGQPVENLARQSRNQSGLPLEPQNFEQGMSNIEGEFPSFGGVAAGWGGFLRKQKTCQKNKKMTDSNIK